MKDLIRSKAVVYLIAIFIAGVAAGVAGGLALSRQAEHRKPPRPEPKEMVDHILRGLKHDLKLTDDQVRQIRPLIERTSEKIHGCQQDLGKQIGALIKGCNREMEAFLAPEQKQKLAEMERRREQRSGKRPEPDHGGR